MTDWALSNCTDLPADLIDRMFFPDGPISGMRAETRQLCGQCPVKTECEALGVGRVGIWGGKRNTTRSVIKGRRGGKSNTADIDFFQSIGMSSAWIEQKLGLNSDTLTSRARRNSHASSNERITHA